MHFLDAKRNVSRVVLLVLIALVTTASAAKQPTSYCKCICFQNSTIIPLNSPPSADTSSPPSLLRVREEVKDSEDTSQQQHHRELTCNDCNRAFCLDYKLPICKNAKEEDVFAQCFQRDSLKDRTIVTLFIFATVSLLGWALLKPFVVKSGVGDVVQKYHPIGSSSIGEGQGSDLPGPHGSSSRPSRLGRGSISRQGGLNS